MDEDFPWPLVGVIVVVVFLVSCGIYFAVTYRREVKEQITQVSWSRAIDIQTWMTVQESDWDVPPTGREIRNYRAIHHYDRVYAGSHTVCTSYKPITCTTISDYRNEPVYRTKYDYWIDRWIVTKTLELHGTKHEPVWPDVSDLRTHAILELGDEREGTRYSRYTVEFTHNYKLDITEERWRKLKVGNWHVVVVNIFNQAQDYKEGWS